MKGVDSSFFCQRNEDVAMSEHVPSFTIYDVPRSETGNSFEHDAQGDHALAGHDLNEESASYTCALMKADLRVQ